MIRDMTAEQATIELRRVAERYLRVRLNGGDLRPEYPALRDALRDWTNFHPKQAMNIDGRWRLSMDALGEPVLVRLDLDYGARSKTRGTCVPSAGRGKYNARKKGATP